MSTCCKSLAVISGLGLRLGPHSTKDCISGKNCNDDSGRVFVTELIPGGAAERSNLLRLNDEILHVDHIETRGRTVVIVF